MGYKRKTLSNKKIYIASAVGLLSACAIIGGVMVKDDDSERKNNNNYIVDLNEEANSVGINGGNKVENNTTTYDFNQSENNTNENEEKETSTEEESLMSSENETTTFKEEVPTEDNNIITNGEVEKETTASSTEVGVNGNGINRPSFSKESIFTWPVNGSVIIDYDMENVVYFPTLDVYKCSDALCISSKEGTPVYAGADGTVLEISKNNEIGNYVRMNLGNGYEVTYGSLKDIQVSGGLTIKKGDLIGYVAKPSKYYAVEGDNLYIKMTENGSSIDPLDYLNYE